ncbi:spore coat protein SA [Clostridium tepidiprofundi DSM 19306]|uniref:Spore coat protein SA n=1 Tax=Clostridium tepidiprofundi DSM 19306 TaxID=1121338 RepID=A0A151B5H8_9CLOT|nr:glycosyltransferase family 4 protein [Clostridium tepidiprofundi]KYH35136.1 spore coat protein SA [Clostridium tepidiprofundi DSM 19306]
MSIKVCHISTVHRAFDIRIFHKECKTLSKYGYDVSFIVTHDKNESVDGVNIIPLSQNQNRFVRIFKKTFEAYKKAKKINADIYHFHDPELIFIGLLLKLKGKKVIYDVHEDVPMQILTKEWLGWKGFRKAISFLYSGIEKLTTKAFDGIITVTPGISKKFPSDKVEVIRNLPIISIIDRAKKIDIEHDKPVIVYAGGLTEIRGIKEIIKAVGILKGEIELWLLGTWEDSKYESECMQLEGWNYTRYFGHKKQEDVYSYIKASDIGIINFLPVPNHVGALPNKVFEYMACGVPIIMSNFPYWKNEFGKFGIMADPEEPVDIAEKIIYLINDYDKLNELGEIGRKEIEDKYSWEAESKKLIKVYEKIGGKND